LPTGNRLSATDPDLGTWAYEYDRTNQLIAQTDARGVRTVMAYDKAGRLLERRIAAPVVANPVLATNTYDEASPGYYNVGRLTTAANGNVTQKLYYSAGGALQRRDDTDSDGTHFVYNGLSANGAVVLKTYSGGLTVGTGTDQWQYDGAGRLKSIPGMVTNQAYEADGQTASITYANGVATTFSYSPTRRWLLRVLTKNAGGAALIDNAYTRDAAGRILTITGLTPAESWTYTYDDLDRLLTATNAGDASLSETYTYAANDNLLSRTRNPGGQSAAPGTPPYVYVYPAGTAARPHTPTNVADRAYTYDVNG
jgi:YD repeat-containing protein